MQKLRPVILGMCLPRYVSLPTNLPALLPERSGLPVPHGRRRKEDPTLSRCWGHQILITSRNHWDHLQMTFAFELINGKRRHHFPAPVGCDESFA